MIETDTSKNGFDACLLQKGHPVAYASHSLTTSEQNYAQIGKELMAMVFAREKFHRYVYGQPVKIMTDHKPLELQTKILIKFSPGLGKCFLNFRDNYSLNISFSCLCYSLLLGAMVTHLVVTYLVTAHALMFISLTSHSVCLSLNYFNSCYTQCFNSHKDNFVLDCL